MSNTYCGRDCLSCTEKETMGCPGCRIGPGRMGDGECELAKCCRNKGHRTCETCVSNRRCGMYLNRAKAPQERQRRLQIEEERNREIAERTSYMKRWLKLLFWLFLPSLIGSIFTYDTIRDLIPAMYIPGLILNYGSTIAYGVALVLMGKSESLYSKAGLLHLLASVISIATSFIIANEAIALLLKLPTAILGILATYNEYQAHSDFLEELDESLSGNWSMLWKAYIITTCMAVGGAFLVVISPALAVIVVLLGAVGLVIVGILHQVLLYNSAKAVEYFCSDVLES